jgi:hypothetical protein
MEYAKNFFRLKVNSNAESTVTTNVFDNKPNSKLVKIYLDLKFDIETKFEDDQIREKISKEEEQKEGNFSNVKEKELINFPRIEIFFPDNGTNNSSNQRIVITPNSINGNLKRLGDKYLFGRNPSTLPNSLNSIGGGKNNDYNFTDESIGIKQFEICFNKDKGKYTIVDNKKGTGLFIKVIQKVAIKQDVIISFCSSHMILQVDNDGKIILLNSLS